MGKRKPRDAADEADGLDEETRLARAVEKAREATKRRNASLFAESALPGAGRRPEANYGDRWEVEEALATVAGGAEVAATLGMAHPDLEPRSAGDPSVDPAAVPDADLDPAERGYHDPEPGELWVKTLDLESGEPYYFNPRTRETTWDEPPPSSRVQIDERVAEAEADARATTPTTRETNEENDENENAAAAADDDAAPDGTAPEPSPATATQTQIETLHPKRHARRYTTADVERLWAMEDARDRAAEPASAEARFGEGTAGVWAARAAAAAAAAAAAEAETSARIDTNPATRTGTAVASNSEWASAVEEGLARANTGADAGSEPTANADALPDDANPSVESEPRWLYLDDTGAWQGPFSRAQLRAWRAMLPMDLVVADRRRGEAAARVESSSKQTPSTTTLARVLGDGDLATRAAALGATLPPRATAAHAERAIADAIAARGASNSTTTRRSPETSRPEVPPSLPPSSAAEAAARSIVAGLDASAFPVAAADPADFARAYAANLAASAGRATNADSYADSYAFSGKMNRLTGRLVAGPAGGDATTMDEAGALYGGGPLGHFADVRGLEASLAEARRARERRAGKTLSGAELARAKRRKAEQKMRARRRANGLDVE